VAFTQTLTRQGVSSQDQKSIQQPPVSTADYDLIESRDLAIPVPGVDPKNVVDSFNEMRGPGRHEATDIPAPRGTLVIAVDSGTVKKLFTSVRGGLTVYQFDASQTYCYYYAHLDRYAAGLEEGEFLKRGDRIGYVGTTGDAPPDDPHLHFAIFKLGAEKHWWQGTPIDPYPFLFRHR
jgi:peptidoglycan LD-endopeptidase LytH